MTADKRISKLEQAFDLLKRDSMMKLIDQTAAKIGQNIELYMPKFSQFYDEYRETKHGMITL